MFKLCFLLTYSLKVSTPVHILDELPEFSRVEGPAIIIQNVATVIIEPGCRARVTASRDLEIFIEDMQKQHGVGLELDPIQLSIFSHRFMGIAEQMGRFGSSYFEPKVNS